MNTEMHCCACCQSLSFRGLVAIITDFSSRPTMARLGIVETIVGVLYAIGPVWFRRLIANVVPLHTVQELKDIVDTMHNTATNFFQSRKQLVKEDGVDNSGREDLLSLLGRSPSLLHNTCFY